MPLAAPSRASETPTTQVSVLLQHARLNHRSNRLFDAAECYRQTLELMPDSQHALLGLSLLARQSRQYEPAMRMAEAALSCCELHSADEALAWAHLGHCLFALRRIHEAEHAFQQALNSPSAGADSDAEGKHFQGEHAKNRAQPDRCPGLEDSAVRKLAKTEAYVGLGELLAASNRTSESIRNFQAAIALAPSLATAHYGLGSVLAQRDDFTGALHCFEIAARLAPTSHLPFFALGFSLARLGQTARAVAAYGKALERRPSFASAWLNLGVALIADGHEQLAGPCYLQAIAVLPSQEEADSAAIQTHISAHLNLGHLERGRRNFQRAQAEYESALRLAHEKEPWTAARRAEIFVAFAYLDLEQGNLDRAWQALDRAEEAERASSMVDKYRGKTPGLNPEIPNARGILLLAQQSAKYNSPSPEGKPGCSADSLGETALNGIAEAIQSFQMAEALGHRTASSNRGNALLRLGRCSEALLAHQTALNLDPYHPGARYNLALTQLRLGDFAQGWENYEIRWSFREVHPRPRRFAQPRWRGEALGRRDCAAALPRLLVYSEQGLGDTIQFVRYLPLVAERLLAPQDKSEMIPERVAIFLEAQPLLARLLAPYLEALQTMFPGLSTQLICHGEALPPFTHHCPLLSMPAIFKTNLDSIPDGQGAGESGYLRADQALILKRATEIGEVEALKECPDFVSCGLTSPAPNPRIGIAWAGNPKYRADHERSIHLKTLLPLLALRKFAWFSLQKGEAATQIRELPAEFRPFDSSSADRDLADTAALIENLDLVITTDTVIAHLAGALGKPLWLLLPWQSDWRWMQEIRDSPWYSTARLFRQSQPGAWRELIESVAEELECSMASPACDTTESPALVKSLHRKLA